MGSTHNSYHVESEGNPVSAWAYTMPPLAEQLDVHGIRHFELDIYADPDGGPLEVFHVPVVDAQSTCDTLVACLQDLAGWSATHRGHSPLVVSIQLKDAVPSDPEVLFADLHDAIDTAWPRDCVVTPDEVQGDAASLGEAIRGPGWPTLGATRGRILFVLLDTDAWRGAYTRGGSDLRERLLFAEGGPDDDWATFARHDDPIGDVAEIEAALAASMMVRTRTDTDGVEAVAEDRTRMDAALAGGAHFVSTDFPGPVADHGYWLEIPGGTPSRCNPVTAPVDCTTEAIEDPATLSAEAL